MYIFVFVVYICILYAVCVVYICIFVMYMYLCYENICYVYLLCRFVWLALYVVCSNRCVIRRSRWLRVKRWFSRIWKSLFKKIQTFRNNILESYEPKTSLHPTPRHRVFLHTNRSIQYVCLWNKMDPDKWNVILIGVGIFWEELNNILQQQQHKQPNKPVSKHFTKTLYKTRYKTRYKTLYKTLYKALTQNSYTTNYQRLQNA